MSGRTKRPCARPGCPSLVVGGYCAACSELAPKRLTEKARPSAHARGYGRRWQKTSTAYLLAHPICADPFKDHGSAPRPAGVTDHIVPHKGDMKLFWDPNNWQPLCKVCHDKKTATEDGGFGNRSGAGARLAPRFGAGEPVPGVGSNV